MAHQHEGGLSAILFDVPRQDQREVIIFMLPAQRRYNTIYICIKTTAALYLTILRVGGFAPGTHVQVS